MLYLSISISRYISQANTLLLYQYIRLTDLVTGYFSDRCWSFNGWEDVPTQTLQ